MCPFAVPSLRLSHYRSCWHCRLGIRHCEAQYRILDLENYIGSRKSVLGKIMYSRLWCRIASVLHSCFLTLKFRLFPRAGFIVRYKYYHHGEVNFTARCRWTAKVNHLTSKITAIFPASVALLWVILIFMLGDRNFWVNLMCATNSLNVHPALHS